MGVKSARVRGAYDARMIGIQSDNSFLLKSNVSRRSLLPVEARVQQV